MPVSKLIFLSLEFPPESLKFFFYSNLFSPTILISNSKFTPVFKKTFSLTFSINFSTSAEVAFPLFMKKLQCFLDILAPPTVRFEQSDDLISFHAFSSLGFLNVLPHVLILFG